MNPIVHPRNFPDIYTIKFLSSHIPVPLKQPRITPREIKVPATLKQPEKNFLWKTRFGAVNPLKPNLI
jgi:hypothetical protein